MKAIEEIVPVDAVTFEREVRPLYRPVVMRGIARDWPVVQGGLKGADQALSHVEKFDTGRPADIMLAPQSERGRFFYSHDMRGFNFRREKLTLTGLAEHLREIADSEDPIGIYAGAAATAVHLPGFDQINPLPLVADMQAAARIWLGNASQVATHFDLSDNIAVVALGTRRFTLFPPEATKDLYVGPLNITLAGQPVSMVDPLAPDLERYPRYQAARQKALVAELEPGDAIYIPTLWWHHVESRAAINILVNYWHNDAQHGGGFLALAHAMLSIRDLPQKQREAWRHWFDHFVFGEDAAGAAEHLPPYAQGVNGPASPDRDEQIRRFVVQELSSR
ncbi:cupin-like domain-containing protein [Qipengyuania marisflavi]|uniref:Cupin-like domain-containing protein n=1 Tax=Qipengyuania marisflavi TaxID=2486356 RepID=A0A5S3NYH6_9SPHN|nr:cupin-like domain-containing protein [Qipengyuania marisflavi]TMM45175.1 cupin-like domain-containing protein [Qipengyuania marisflavi]